MEKQFSTEHVIGVLTDALDKAQTQGALAKKLGVIPQLISAAVNTGYVSTALAKALGYEPVKGMFYKLHK